MCRFACLRVLTQLFMILQDLGSDPNRTGRISWSQATHVATGTVLHTKQLLQPQQSMTSNISAPLMKRRHTHATQWREPAATLDPEELKND